MSYSAGERSTRPWSVCRTSDGTIPVEIRVVLHRLTIPRLVPLAEFLYRNFPFASQIALMGLEMTGFAVGHADELWIDPWDYRDPLTEAALHLASRGMSVSIYNLPLCVTPRELRPYYRRSISDWKNDYLPECAGCAAREDCGGFFTSSIQRGRLSRHIIPLTS